MNRIRLSVVFISCCIINTINCEISNRELFEGKNILILGGTGFLGRSIAAEVLKYNPHKIILFGRDEVKHFNIKKMFPNCSLIKNVIGDIRDYHALVNVTKNIDIVFHVAALKRIDMLEENVAESIKTNIIGSLNVFNACIANNVKKVLFISTDKACSPINTYGASKFLIEKLFTNYDKDTINTIFCVARFGNILGSTGSIIPIFLEKIMNNEDLTITDERMTRFIISKEEAIELVFDAVRYSVGGEIFLKKLPSLKITDLINVLKNKFKSTNDNLCVIGIRPGEKIHEVLLNRSEILKTFEFKDYYVIVPNIKNLLSVKPTYIQEGKFLGETMMKSINSKNTLISYDEIFNIFTKFGIAES